jgi:hypothetical protein
VKIINYEALNYAVFSSLLLLSLSEPSSQIPSIHVLSFMCGTKFHKYTKEEVKLWFKVFIEETGKQNIQI